MSSRRTGGGTCATRSCWSAGFPLLSGVHSRAGRREPSRVVTGANGAGKTSLLRLLGGLVALTSGAGVVGGVDLDRRATCASCAAASAGSATRVRSTTTSPRTENLTFAAKALGRPIEEIDSGARARRALDVEPPPAPSS